MKICMSNNASGLTAFLLSLDLKLNQEKNEEEILSIKDSAEWLVESLVRILNKLLKQSKKETEREIGTDLLNRKESSDYSRIKSPKDFSVSDEYDPYQ